jgi:hypothetical protein
MTSEGGGNYAREAVLTNLTWLNHVERVRQTSAQFVLPLTASASIKAGTLNIWLLHHGTHAIASARSGKLCVLDLRLTRRLTVRGCLHSCMHCGEVCDTMEACVHRMLYCSAVQSVWTSFASGLWPKAELGSTLIGLGVFYSVSRMER